MNFLTAPKHLTPSAPTSSPEIDAGFGIYVHWPYCEAKCPYCDFNSYARKTITEAQFVEGVLRELDYYAGLTRGRTVSSIFFGGGTPSLMAAATVEALIDRIAALWPVSPSCEITLEANPSSVEAGRFSGYRAAGVNRVSLGVQALHDDVLRFLGRLHTAAEARAALAIAAKNFERASFDLIYARPGQSTDMWRAELGEALSMAQGHMSLYQLTIEPETAFFDLEQRGKLMIPEAESAAALYELTQEMCEAVGLPAYEISNHAGPGEESRHNLTYWRYGDYAGVGPGAHGRLMIDGKKFATAALRSPQQWYSEAMRTGRGLDSETPLNAREQAEEMLLMGLRLREGVSLPRLESLTGYSPSVFELEHLARANLIELDANRTLRATASGRMVLNAVIKSVAASLTPAA